MDLASLQMGTFKEKYENYRPKQNNKNLLLKNSSKEASKTMSEFLESHLLQQRDDHSLAFKFGYGSIKNFSRHLGSLKHQTKSNKSEFSPQDLEDKNMLAIRESLYKFRLEDSSRNSFKKPSRSSSPRCLGFDSLLGRIEEKQSQLNLKRAGREENEEFEAEINQRSALIITSSVQDKDNLRGDYGLKYRWKGLNTSVLEGVIKNAKYRIKKDIFHLINDLSQKKRSREQILNLSFTLQLSLPQFLIKFKNEYLNSISQKNELKGEEEELVLEPSRREDSEESSEKEIDYAEDYGEQIQPIKEEVKKVGKIQVKSSNQKKDHQHETLISSNREFDLVPSFDHIVSLLRDNSLQYRLENAKIRMSFLKHKKLK